MRKVPLSIGFLFGSCSLFPIRFLCKLWPCSRNGTLTLPLILADFQEESKGGLRNPMPRLYVIKDHAVLLSWAGRIHTPKGEAEAPQRCEGCSDKAPCVKASVH